MARLLMAGPPVVDCRRTVVDCRRQVEPDQRTALWQLIHSSSSPTGDAAASSSTRGSSPGRIAATSSSSV